MQLLKIKLLIALVIVMSVGSLAGTKKTPLVAKNAPPQVFTGEISDSQCAFNVHSHDSSHELMIKSGIMGNTPEECARACVRNGGKYALVDTINKKVYHLDNQAAAGKFAGQQVRIRGVYDKEANELYIIDIKPVK